MPSRKKAKGKARKANKANTNNCNLILHNDSVCRHGCDIVSKDDICFKFIERFEVELRVVYDSIKDKEDFTFLDCLRKVTERLKASAKYSLIYDDKTNQEKLLPMFVNLGTNLLLKYRQRSTTDMAVVVAVADLYCQHSFDDEAVIKTQASRNRLRDLSDGNEYDALRYFIKRTPCRCLKTKYSIARAKQRNGKCRNCEEVKDRKLLPLCSGCRYFGFCDVECQRAHWPGHKSYCMEIQIGQIRREHLQVWMCNDSDKATAGEECLLSVMAVVVNHNEMPENEAGLILTSYSEAIPLLHKIFNLFMEYGVVDDFLTNLRDWVALAQKKLASNLCLTTTLSESSSG